MQRTLKLWFHEIHRHLRLPAPDLSDHTNEQGMVHGVSSQYSEDEKRWLVTDFVLHPFRLMLNSQALKRFSLPNLPLPGGKTFRTRPAKTDLIVRNDELALQLEMIHPGHQPTLVEPDHLGWALELLRQLEITPLQTDAVRGEILFASEAEFEIAEKFLSLHAENILPL